MKNYLIALGAVGWMAVLLFMLNAIVTNESIAAVVGVVAWTVITLGTVWNHMDGAGGFS